MINPKNNNRSEIRLKVWIEDGKLAFELTDALGRKNKTQLLNPNATLELWTAAAYGNLFIQEPNKMAAYDVITSEKIEHTI
jgi:hypothetical protein